MAWSLLLASCLLLLLVAAVYNEFVVALVGGGQAQGTTLQRIRNAQLWFVLSGAALGTCALLVRRIPLLTRLTGRPGVTETLLAVLSVCLPLWILELTLRPYAPVPRFTTNAYIRDPHLGWRLNPGVETRDIGGRLVKINNKGLRGPEVDYAKHPETKRILYLGDSVTYGWLLDYESTFPRQTEPVLERLTGVDVETVNAGVSGYSPWQEYNYLVREGIRYEPDLVVVSFVMNDVTEKFGLTRFGGSGEGFQLGFTATSVVDQLAATSAVFHYLRKLAAQLRFGPDPAEGARRAEGLSVIELFQHPDQPRVREAWRITLENLDRIVEFCRAIDTPMLLVIFPMAVQLKNVEGLAEPQPRLIAFAESRGVPAIDLLPVLAAEMARTGMPPEHYFLDGDHPSAAGAALVAQTLAEFIWRERLLEPFEAH